MQRPTDSCPACLSDTATHVGGKNGHELYRCGSCRTVRVSPLPTPEQLSEFYHSYVGTADYTKKRARKIQRSRRRIKRLMGKTSGMEFLDVGCNYGFAVAAAAALGLNAHGINIDDTAIASCQQEFGKVAKFDFRTVEDHAASGAKADIIYTSEVIEHTLNPNSFVAALQRILKPGGVLYLTAPDGGHFRVPGDFTQWTQVIPPEHLTYFSRRGMKKLLERQGFTHVKFRLNHKTGISLTARKAS